VGRRPAVRGADGKLPETPVEFLQPPVTFGEHNDYIYRDVLGFSEDEYSR
jgi:hypothetical protein